MKICRQIQFKRKKNFLRENLNLVKRVFAMKKFPTNENTTRKHEVIAK